jgi:amino acid permease
VLGNGWHLEEQFQMGMIMILVFIFLSFEKRLDKLAKSSYFSISFISVLILLCFLIGNLNDGAEFIYMQF